MLDNDSIVSSILSEIEEMDDWITLSGAFGACGVDSFEVTKQQALDLLTAVENDPRIFIGKLSSDASEIEPISVSVSELVDQWYEQPSNAIDKMMQYFVVNS